MSYGKRSRKLPYANVRRASHYLIKKGVKEAYIFGSGLKRGNLKHDLDIVVDVLPSSKNKRKFDDAIDYGIDLFLLDPSDFLFSVGLNEFLYDDNGELRDLEDVKARRFSVVKVPKSPTQL